MRRVRCPVCEEPSDTGGAQACECGYDFAHADATIAIGRLGYARKRAHRLLRRGIGTVIATLIPMFLLATTPGEQIELMTIIVAQLVLGGWWFARGVLESSSARRRLRAAATIGQLPEARLLE